MQPQPSRVIVWQPIERRNIRVEKLFRSREYSLLKFIQSTFDGKPIIFSSPHDNQMNTFAEFTDSLPFKKAVVLFSIMAAFYIVWMISGEEHSEL